MDIAGHLNCTGKQTSLSPRRLRSGALLESEELMDNLENLVALRHQKMAEILGFMAKSYGLGDFGAVPSTEQARLREEAENIVDEHNEARGEAEPVAMASLDARLNRSEVGRLLNELHEIDEQILDIQDDDIDPDAP